MYLMTIKEFAKKMKVIKFLCPRAFAFLFLLSPEAVGGVC